MCGIAFLYSNDSVELVKHRISNALDLMRHRGPNDSGVIESSGAYLGHRRLSIIDVAGSRQPMQDVSGRFTITYNGEIYNYRELRTKFIDQWDFQTDGDTELLLAGLITQGVKFLEQLEGMWAFCLWDSENKVLMFSRDRIGKKPLYFQNYKNDLAIASELRALRALNDDAAWDEDRNSVIDYFRYGYCLPGETFYTGVKEMLPGHYAIWSPGSKVKIHKYWHSSHKPFGGTFRDACALIKPLFLSSVKRRMVSDVEVGAFLSGGVDSSLVVAAIRRVHPGNLKTFTIGFVDPGYDERKHAREISKRYSTDHYEDVLDYMDSACLARLVLEHVGQPFADASLLPTAMVSSLAAKHVKVVLSGDGSDEFFAGYQRYAGKILADWYGKCPKCLRNLFKVILRSVPEPRVHHSHSLVKKSHLFLDLVQSQDHSYIGPRIISETDIMSLLRWTYDFEKYSISVSEISETVINMMNTDQLVYLPQDILTKVDRASMAYSLEARAPFLDSTLVEFARSLPLSFHMRMLKGKYILKEAFKDWIPDSIWSRRKHGFAVPLGNWFLGKLGEELEGRIQENTHPLNQSFVLNRLEIHREQKRDFGQFLWAVYVYLLWRDINKIS